MQTCVGLLRGINVGGHKAVSMAALRDLLTRRGFGDVRSVLQSGNIVFRHRSQTLTQLERIIESAILTELDLQTELFIRSSEEWRGIVSDNPCLEAARRDPAHVVVMFLKQAPTANAITALQATITGPEVVRAVGRQLYITYPAGIGTSRLTGAVIEKTLGTSGTARNWNTVLKLAVLSEAGPLEA